jgi:Ca2+-binding EF-hand superfamily protein
MGNSGFSKEEAAEYKEKYGLNRRAIEKTAEQWSKATNGTMSMNLPEFVAWCKSLNYQASLEKDERFERLFKLIDRDGSGTVNFREILLVEGMPHLSAEERVRFVFELYDEDKDGKLTEADILIMAKDLFKSYPELQFRGILTYNSPSTLTQ